MSNLRLNSQQEENENSRDKRKLSAELNNDDDDDNDNDNDIKKPKIEDETCLVTQPKIVQLKENPIFDQIKLANCFLRDQSLIKAKREWDKEEENGTQEDEKTLPSPQNFIPSMSLSSTHSTSTNDFNQRNSVGKHSVVNSNSKLLEKVTLSS